MRSGKLFIPHRDQFDTALAQVHDCRAIVSVTEYHGERSRQAEKYYHAVIVDQVSSETGFEEDETHDLMKAMHLPRGLHAHFGGDICWRCSRVIGGSTRRLSNWEYWRYIENCRRWAATSIGLYLPEPREDMVAA